MNSMLVAPAIMVGIGLFFGTILAIAQRFLKVDEDPRIEATNELLPGTNCGACGQPGCLPFAEKLVTGEVDPGECTVSTDDNLEQIAEYLNVDAGRAEKLVARLSCGGGGLQAHQIAEYRGFEGCRAAAVVSGGGKGCKPADDVVGAIAGGSIEGGWTVSLRTAGEDAISFRWL